MVRVHKAPVVSADSNSPEAIMARDSKNIQLQLAMDTKYDAQANYEHFVGTEKKTLLLLSIALLFGIIAFKTRHK
jgi:hypothetical protein